MIKTELISTITRLRTAKDATKFGYLGRQVQAWFLREVRRHDDTVSSHLHTLSSDASDKDTYDPIYFQYCAKDPIPQKVTHE